MVVRIGTWPGAGSSLNTFIDIFCSSLRVAGLEVVDVPDPLAIDPDLPGIDILQIHWAEMIFHDKGRLEGIAAAVRLLSKINRLKAHGVKIVWLVHNLKPHDMKSHRKPVWKWFSSRLARSVDGVLSLSPATLPIILNAFPFRASVSALSLRHPSYPCAGKIPHRAQRQRFAIPSKVLSFVYAGIIRPYKGVDQLAACIASMPANRYHLTISGLVRNASYKDRLDTLAAKAPNVRLRLGAIDTETFEALIASADYVVLPFIDTLHSGSIIHALSLGRAVVTPATPYARDLQKQVGAPWLSLYEGSISREVLFALPPPPEGIPDLSCLSPNLFGKDLAIYYQKIADTTNCVSILTHNGMR